MLKGGVDAGRSASLSLSGATVPALRLSSSLPYLRTRKHHYQIRLNFFGHQGNDVHAVASSGQLPRYLGAVQTK
jgi:hypothetical protein